MHVLVSAARRVLAPVCFLSIIGIGMTRLFAAAPAHVPGPATMTGSAPLLQAQLRDLEDHPLRLKSYYEAAPEPEPTFRNSEPRGPVLVVLHQDRSSSEQNHELKEQIGHLAVAAGKRRGVDKIRVVALADVGGYD